MLLERHWDLSEEILLPLCWHLIEKDPFDEVRAYSLNVIGSTLEGTHDETCSQALAKKIADSNENSKVQVAAFGALVRVCSIPIRQLSGPEACERLREDYDRIKRRCLTSEEIEWARSFLND